MYNISQRRVFTTSHIMSYTRKHTTPRIKQNGGSRKSLSSLRKKELAFKVLVRYGILTAAAAAALNTKKGQSIINEIFTRKHSGTPSTRSTSSARTRKSQQCYSTLMTIYEPGYQPPAWTEHYYDQLSSHFGKSSTVYYHQSTTRDEVVKVATEREPVNIAQDRFYNASRMNTRFGWKYGYYQRYFDTTKSLPPNIAIYCQTPVVPVSASPPISLDTKVHILHSIGYAFDTESQPDYKVLFTKNNINDNKRDLITRYTDVFKLVFACMKHKKLTQLYMGLVGAGFFASLYPEGLNRFKHDVWKPAFDAARSQSDITLEQVCIMGGGDAHGLGYTMAGFFPEVALSMQESQRKITLFVNAWDPFSMVGNGNANDNSLDGHVGRTTASALLCWPYSNPSITYHCVQ